MKHGTKPGSPRKKCQQQTHIQSFKISHSLLNDFPTFQHLTFANADKGGHPRDYPRQCRRMPHAEGNFAVAKGTICVRCLRHKFWLANHRNLKRSNAQSMLNPLWPQPLRLPSPEPWDRNLPCNKARGFIQKYRRYCRSLQPSCPDNARLLTLGSTTHHVKH